ncbi:Hypothetical predicted protein, partial [Paramuricea clavata]
MSTTTKLLVDGGIYRFNGLLSDLRLKVLCRDETLGVPLAVMSSSLINAVDCGFAIKWYGHSKKLVIQTDNEHYLKRKFASLANPVGSDVAAGDGVSVSKVCTCPYTCVNSDIIAELEGVKLDMTILGSRLFASISQQESKSDDINSLRVKQKDIEAIINKKDEVICKLNEEIQYIKTKLLSLERGGAQNDLANKGRGLINASNEIPNNSKNKDPSQNNNVFNTMDDSFCLTNELPTIMNKNQLSSTIIEIPPSNDEDQHHNLTNAT